MSDEDVKKTFEEHGGTLDTDAADIEYFGVTYEWKIQECDLPEQKNSGLNLNIPVNDQPEFFGQIIDCFDGFLEEQEVRLPRSDKEMADDGEDDCNAARIYGSDYDDLNDKIQVTIKSWAETETAQSGGKKQTEKSDVVARALNNLNIKWCQEDLEGILEDADIPVTQENLERLCKQITDDFQGILIEETNERLQFLAIDMKAKEKKEKEKMAGKGSCTRAWKVYGREGHRQRESFAESYTYDFSNKDNGTRIISVLNSDKTGSNDFTIIQITRNTREECAREFDGQLLDGIFENSDVGKVEEIDPIDLPLSVK